MYKKHNFVFFYFYLRLKLSKTSKHVIANKKWQKHDYHNDVIDPQIKCNSYLQKQLYKLEKTEHMVVKTFHRQVKVHTVKNLTNVFIPKNFKVKTSQKNKKPRISIMHSINHYMVKSYIAMNITVWSVWTVL